MSARGYRAQRGKGFETYPRELLQPDPGRMTVRALGVLVHLLSLPPGFNVSAESLARQFREGRVAIAATLDELEHLGHLARARIQDPATGQWGWVWVYGDDPYEVERQFAERVAEHGGGASSRHLTERTRPAVGATSENTPSAQLSPNAGHPTSGHPTPGDLRSKREHTEDPLRDSRASLAARTAFVPHAARIDHLPPPACSKIRHSTRAVDPPPARARDRRTS